MILQGLPPARPLGGSVTATVPIAARQDALFPTHYSASNRAVKGFVHAVTKELAPRGVSGYAVNPRSGTFSCAPNLRGFGNPSLSHVLHDEYGVSGVITSDVNAALLGESWLGAAGGWRHVVMVSIGTGLGEGILVDGKLYTGASAGAGEPRFIASDERAARTKEHGCLVTVASGYRSSEAALGMCWARIDRDGDQEGVLDKGSRVQELIERAQRGETDAAGLVHQLAHCMALGIDNDVGLSGPESVVLGGGMTSQHGWLMQNVIERFHEYSTFSVPTWFAELGEKSDLYGAVEQGLDPEFSAWFAIAGGSGLSREHSIVQLGGRS